MLSLHGRSLVIRPIKKKKKLIFRINVLFNSKPLLNWHSCLSLLKNHYNTAALNFPQQNIRKENTEVRCSL